MTAIGDSWQKSWFTTCSGWNPWFQLLRQHLCKKTKVILKNMNFLIWITWPTFKTVEVPIPAANELVEPPLRLALCLLGLLAVGRGEDRTAGRWVNEFQHKSEEFMLVYMQGGGCLRKGILSDEKYVQFCLRRSWEEGSKSLSEGISLLMEWLLYSPGSCSFPWMVVFTPRILV